MADDKYTLEEIRDYWTRQAHAHNLSPGASWSDTMVIDLEIQEILKHLQDGDEVLDAGCANGYSTVQFAANKKVSVLGLDYVPEMIQQARERQELIKDKLRGNVRFDVGDITDLREPEARYDKVVVIRVIINLRERERQILALRQCARVLKRGGVLLLSEATVQGWLQLNRFRREWGLPDIPIPAFNEYIDYEDLVRELSHDFELLDVIHFASTYYVCTRVIKPLLAKALGGRLVVGNPAMEWNRWAAQLPPWGDYGTQKLILLKKK